MNNQIYKSHPDQTVICTIVAKNYLPQARCLTESFLEHHPEGQVFVLLVDKIDGYFDPLQEQFTTIELKDLDIPELKSMVNRYKIIELCTAVKPFFLQYLFDRYKYNKICYFDPDIYFYQSVEDEIWKKLDRDRIILTPHLLAPIDDECYPNEIAIMQAGIYNLGFIGLRKHTEVEKLLSWWHSKLVKYCYMEPEQGMHVDQNWIDYVPSRFDHVYISRHPGINAAYWDLSNRCPEYIDRTYIVNGVPLNFFHFSGYDPDKPDIISKHQNRFTFSDLPQLKPLFEGYRERLKANGWDSFRNFPNAYYPQPSVKSTPIQDRPPENLIIQNPIQFPYGINILGYVNGEFGVGEAARANIRSIEAADIPFSITNLTPDFQRNLDLEYQKFSQENPYPINLLHINADSVSGFAQSDFGRKYLQNRYNIGVWYWEVPIFPEKWKPAFQFFDEIWTGSNYAAEAISKVSPIPVIKVINSVAMPQPSISREELHLPKDRFIFLFIFDFLSVFDRKNPLTTIEAFKRAFGSDNDKVLLTIKFSNSQYFPEQLRVLQKVTKSCSSIRLIDGYLSRPELNALVYNCDCYVSLHRSEGFGLTLAEAMFYGKPAIATGYSGNLEFMNVGNSFLVPYDLLTLDRDYGPYEKGNVWADPDINRAAELMKYVFDHQKIAKEIGERASREIKSLLNPKTVGQTIENRLQEIRRMNVTRPNHMEKLQSATGSLDPKAQAWMQAAQQIQRELLEYQSSLSTR
ncbi:glycosyltransferase [Planktothricoides sp. SR001]|uniref:glycosyltransferase n=1 Tax=Planktothricoides sp. SR001 TaxID=1705388 RepID=UPI0006C8945A|nr:glycosyltransferase [Planktothricoides sp. SR001]